MLANLIIFVGGVVLAASQHGGQYPAGIDPSTCPNYPICENPLVAISQPPQGSNYGQASAYGQAPQFVPASQYAAAPRYTAQQYTPQFAPAPLQQYQQPVAQQYQYPVQSPAPAPAPAAAEPQYSPEIQNALDRGEYIGDGDYHGDPLQTNAPQAVPVGPTYSQTQTYAASPYSPYPVAQPPVLQNQPVQIPAGLDPRACPNYPYCH